MTTKSQNPAYPDAHPTAPGGMSKKSLIAEMVEKHGYENDKEAWAQVSWPDLIDMVIQERLDREAEAKAERPEPDDADDTERIETEDGDLPEWDTPSTPVDPSYGVETEDTNLLEQATLRTERGDFSDTEMIVAEYASEFEPEAAAMFEVLDDCECGFCGTCTDAEYADVEEGTLTAMVGDDHLDDADELADAMEAHEVEDMMGEYDDGVLDPEQMFAEMTAAREEATPPPVFIGIPGTRDYIFDGHAGAGPSGAERWMNCTMSLSASRKFLETLSPNQQANFAKAGTAAAQGTTAHAAAEVEANMILGRVTQEEVDHTLLELSVSPEDEGEAYDDEMAEYITEYMDLVKSFAQERGNDHVLIESRVEAAIPLTDMHEGEVYVIRGSADLIALPTKTDTALVVGDLKYGEGLDVDVDENPQIRLYALGVLELLADPETGALPEWLTEVNYYIIQPRLGGIKPWTETIDDLLEWRDEVLAPALTKALYGANEGATFEPSELACQWCPARGGCPALTEQRLDAASDLFDVIVESEFENGPGTFPETTTLSDERLGELLTQVAGLTGIYKDLREEAQRRLHRGTDVPGYWLVNYSPKRHWVEGADEKLADLEDVWTEPSLMSPPQAEKVLGKEEFANIEALVVKPDKRPVISTGLGDKRKHWEGKPPEQMFAVEAELEEES